MNPLRLKCVAIGVSVLALLGQTIPACAAGYVQSFVRNNSGVTIYFASGALSVEVCSSNIIHIVASPTRKTPAAIVPTVNHRCHDNDFKVVPDKLGIAIQTPALHVSIDRASGALRFTSTDGKMILSEPAGGGRTLTPVTIDGTPTFHVQQQFLSPPDEALYGLGQHQEGNFDLRGVPQHLLQANTNIVIPFLLSTKGYGLLWNNPSLTDYDIADQAISLDPKTGEGIFRADVSGKYGFLLKGNGRSRLQLSVGDNKIIDLTNMWVADSAGAKIDLKAGTEYKISAQTGGETELFARRPSDTLDFHSEAGNAVDYYFFYGPALRQVIQGYRFITGTAPLLPRWAYGFWQCRERYSSQQQILGVATEFRNRNIPVDVMVQDWQYWGKYGWNAMRFDEKYYPDPAQLMSSLHQKNLHMVISVWAKFGSKTAVDQDFKNDNLVLTSEAASAEPGESKEKEDWADLFNPKAQSLFWAEINRNLFHFGLDGWWLDASEPGGDPLATDETFLGPGRLVRNAYPLYETTAVFNGQKAEAPNRRVVILTRSSFAGLQRNSAISWSGDISANWETLRRQIPAGLSFSMSGIPYWTTDIGGFFRPTDQYTSEDYRELLIRWFEFGTFSPIFRVHGYRSETEMWKYGPQVEQNFRQFDTLRYRLLPYIYTQAWDVTHQGGTLMRALPLEFPTDPRVRDISDQFMFGPSLLISPVVEKGARERNVCLPGGGNWVDFWTGQNHKGGESTKASAPLSQIPIHVRQGSILPLGPIVQSAEDAADPLEIRIYPGRDGDFRLYEDQGDSYSYESGQRATIPMHWDDRRNLLVVGPTIGSFPNMLKQHTLRIVKVREGHGVGVLPEENVDRVVQYGGKRVTLEIPDSPTRLSRAAVAPGSVTHLRQ